MKKTIIFLVCAMFIGFTLQAQQTAKEIEKELKEKAIKSARKEAKQMDKEGWQVNPGSLPLEKILEQAWGKQMLIDENGDPRYITADGNAVAQSKSAAEMQAIEFAKLQLAGMVQTNISSLIDANIANAQLSTEEAASVTEVVQSAKNIIATELGFINPFFKVFKSIKNNQVEVQVRIFYDTNQQ